MRFIFTGVIIFIYTNNKMIRNVSSYIHTNNFAKLKFNEVIQYKESTYASNTSFHIIFTLIYNGYFMYVI